MVPFRLGYIFFVKTILEYHCRLCEGKTHEQAQHGLSPEKQRMSNYPFIDQQD
jgi:hypothetical protein